jgi:LDH2 family malate/lactate/ureidoglycolate dehydrogenase
MRVEPRSLAQAVALILTRAGAEPDIAADVAGNLVEADCAGHASHGVRLVGLYVERLRTGDVSGKARPLVSSDTGPLVAIDGNLAFGQIVGAFAARCGIDAAKKHGVAAVAISRSGHFGRNGKWPEMAAAESIASVHFINSPNTPSAIVPHGGREARLTSNPIALGAPQPDGDHLILDFSVAEVAVNAIKLAAARGERLPSRCVLDANGEPTDNPAAFLESPTRAMLAFGGFKGYALGVFTEIFAGAVAGGLCHTGEPAGKPVNNMLSFYLDPVALRQGEDYARNLRLLIEWLQRPDATGHCAPLPGDRSRAMRRRSDQRGPDLDASTVGVIIKAAEHVGADPDVRALLNLHAGAA